MPEHCFGHGAVKDPGAAEVALQQVPEIGQILDVNRAIQTQLTTRVFDF